MKDDSGREAPRSNMKGECARRRKGLSEKLICESGTLGASALPRGAVELYGPSQWSHIKAKGLRLCPLSQQLVIKNGLPPVKVVGESSSFG